MIEYSRVEVQHPELKALADAVDDENEDYLARRKKRTDPEGQSLYMAAYRRVSASDPVQQGWDENEKEFHAKTKIFTVMAKAFEDEIGKENGRQAVARARLRQGEEMGKLMAQRVRAEGKRLTLNHLFEQFWAYFSWSPKVDDERYFNEEGNLVRYVLRLNCPIGDYLKEHAPDVEFASNYCDLDEFIAKAYNPNIRYSRRHWVPGGDAYSELVWELDKDGIIE